MNLFRGVDEDGHLIRRKTPLSWYMQKLHDSKNAHKNMSATLDNISFVCPPTTLGSKLLSVQLKTSKNTVGE